MRIASIVLQAGQFSYSLAYVTIRDGACIRIISNVVSFDGGRESMDTMSGKFFKQCGWDWINKNQ